MINAATRELGVSEMRDAVMATQLRAGQDRHERIQAIREMGGGH